MTETHGVLRLALDELTNPCTARLSDVVFDQRADIAIIQSHKGLATALNKNLAQRWIETQTPHETHMLLFFLFWQSVPLSGQTLFFG